ncbi:hypothetical protein [Carboxylicivirga caseinilyticus]|uniref:hypothetical protein n=1 Tax=Carboxylicivirga caseinilyticus TaxID=3417572 RepID=UPI003D33034D|nr:hypothetical protein [Marinilabiliaceae bacterium A049]
MEVVEVKIEEFKAIESNQLHVFQSVAFNELNREKCDKVYYLLFKDSKYRLGLILGAREESLYSPFSAPFGGFIAISNQKILQYLDVGISSLLEWSTNKGFTSIHMTLPPTFYNESLIANQMNSLWRKGFELCDIDLNYSFSVDFLNDNYLINLPRNARKNLKIALKSELDFKLCLSESEKFFAYEVIKKNREERGFPLRMSWQQVSDTISIIDADFFLVYTNTNVAIASAVVFHVTDKIVQVIYWGDLHDYAGLKTMNYLSFKVFEYYKLQGISIVDIGPSTENSIPNHGLVEFKESIGCKVSPKYKFEIKIT